jgi:hypothetical protein
MPPDIYLSPSISVFLLFFCIFLLSIYIFRSLLCIFLSPGYTNIPALYLPLLNLYISPCPPRPCPVEAWNILEEYVRSGQLVEIGAGSGDTRSYVL